jgi:RNA polymerase sigma factor (TIGR02999 family)
MSEMQRPASESSTDPNGSSDEMLQEVYLELRKLARLKLAQESPGQTLQATALVHEAYLRLTAGERGSRIWDNRGHFFVAAADSMRRILIERARRKRRVKHGGGRRRIDLSVSDTLAVVDERPDEVLAVIAALDKLSAENPEKAKLVELRVFTGLSHQEAAEILGISRSSADRYWKYAKAFLLSEVNEISEA